MESRKYEDKSGNKRTAWELQAEGFEFCGSKSSAPAESAAPDVPADPAPANNDVPF